MRVRWAALVFVLTMVVEIVVFILVGQLIGFGWRCLLAAGHIAAGRFGCCAAKAYARGAGSARWPVPVERPGPHLTRSLVGLLARCYSWYPVL